MQNVSEFIIGSFATGRRDRVCQAFSSRRIANTSLIGNDFIFHNADPDTDLDILLMGDANNPGGNVELFASSETVGFTGARTSIAGTSNGTDILISSLTADDWGDGSAFGLQWFGDFIQAAIQPMYHNTLLNNLEFWYGRFVANDGREIFSDPNIAYVNPVSGTDDIAIGLAGRLDSRDRILEVLPLLDLFLNPPEVGISASEIVRVDSNGETHYLYSFIPTSSDPILNSAIYEVTFTPSPASVPEPGALLGLLVVGGAIAKSGSWKCSERRS